MQEIKVGLEIHGYLNTKEKLFCRCKAVRHSLKKEIKENSFVCPICTGQPGSKPMLPNSSAIARVVEIALMLNSEVNLYDSGKELVWNRKHYSWPDLPKGYQNTISGAYSVPVAEKGKFEGIKIREIHLEEDPAQWNPETGGIDYNRSGLPLVEIVTEPDFDSPDKVVDWLKKLVLTLSYIKAVDKNAGIKVDVNISTKKTDFKERVEIKNLSSLENIRKAIEFEAKRQETEKTGKETRRYDEKNERTIKMRDKEGAEDYRFIPDPDLPIIKIRKSEIEKLKKALPESPQEKLDKLIKKHKIGEKDASVLSQNIEVVEFFEKVIEKVNPRFALPWVNVELMRVLNWNKKTLDEVEIMPEHFIELLQLVESKKLTELKAKSILNEFIPKSFSVKERMKEFGKIADMGEIEKICGDVVKNNVQAVQDYLSGKEESLNFLIGEVMKKSNRRADYKTAKEILKKIINNK
ncbi:Asp-tRNA(Asn)/Glu-tRNA(Gln) amidotransferase subunit GatB [Candidatus Pacearchaeota archaeon]|nr:Asp-tRNA(Asn)/Glu-tRNA(Gln) amidotransferase subunit GatB [Candidatus Pacearchaeota archaeon]